MTIRGRVDVYCTDLPGPTFIAVASSTELNDSGRPTVVRIVEFMATDPLYKATRIGDFGDFEFRATELHDDIMTLVQVQQLWNQVPTDARWWPTSQSGQVAHMAPDLVYAVLGPWTTARLIQTLQMSPEQLPDDLDWLKQGLIGCVGHRPKMLLALAAALGAVQRRHNHRFDGGESFEFEGAADLLADETLKHLGFFFVEALRGFSLDESGFAEWFETQRTLFFADEQWPPPQASYTLDGPNFGVADSHPSSELSDFDEPTSLEERQKIQRWLETNSGITTSIYGPNGPVVVPSTFSARSWARLVSATVQAMHMLLADPEVNWTVLSEQEMFIYHLSESISSLPIDSWEQLTPSRRICFVADLGELLMIVAQLVGGDVTGRIAVTLARACGNDADLISIAEQAGRNLPYPDARGDFNWGIEFVRGYQP